MHVNEHYTFAGIRYLDVYTDRPGVDALSTKANVRSAITNWTHDNSDENDIIFIYFSSHGGGYCPAYAREFLGIPFDHVLPYVMRGGRYDVSGDEGNEVQESTFRKYCWLLNALYDFRGDGQLPWDRLLNFDADPFLEIDLDDDGPPYIELNLTNALEDVDGDGLVDDIFVDPDIDDCCDVAIDANVNLNSDGEDGNRDRWIVGLDLNGNGNFNDWVGIDECMQVQDGLYWDDELASDLNTLNYAKLIFVRQGCLEGDEGCFGGGLIDDISAKNIIIMTASDEAHHSYGDMDGDGYSEWSEAFIDALHGENTHYDNGVVNENPREYVDADFNNDGYVSMWEAWDYAWKNDDARLDGLETPWLDDNGNGRPTYMNECDDMDRKNDLRTDGLLSMETYFGFSNLASVDINNDKEVTINDLSLAAKKFGKNEGDPGYDSSYDFNGDHKINLSDLVIIAMHLEKTYKPSGSSMAEYLLGETTSLSVYPSQITLHKHETFSVNISITSVIDMYSWEFRLYWNNAILNCTNDQIYTPEIWGNNTFAAGIGIENDYNATHGRYRKGLTALGEITTFSGSMTVVTLTFEALATGTTALTLQDTIICNSSIERINHTVTSGSVTVTPRERFLRGDTHTINGLTAYKLGTSQSNLVKYFSEIKPEYESAYWGIKVWKRDISGNEFPISSGYVAQVSRTSQGQGIQSATWNCPQTNLTPTDAIVVRVYQKIGGYAWQLAGTFTTEQLGATQLDNSTWQIYYYTKLTFTNPKFGENTIARFHWGTTTYNSRILNFEYN